MFFFFLLFSRWRTTGRKLRAWYIYQLNRTEIETLIEEYVISQRRRRYIYIFHKKEILPNTANQAAAGVNFLLNNCSTPTFELQKSIVFVVCRTPFAARHLIRRSFPNVGEKNVEISVPPVGVQASVALWHLHHRYRGSAKNFLPNDIAVRILFSPFNNNVIKIKNLLLLLKCRRIRFIWNLL